MNANPGTLIRAGILTAILGFVLYRRVRRSFFRQQVRPRSLGVRIVLLAVFGILMLLPPFLTVINVAWAAGGAVVGVGLAMYAFARTEFVVTRDGTFYKQHLYIGLGLTALFLGRVVYRLAMTWPTVRHAAGAGPRGHAIAVLGSQHSPMTVGLFFLLAGFYICYYVNVIRKSRSLEEKRTR